MPARQAVAASIALALLSALIVCAALSDVPGVSTAHRAAKPVIAAVGLEQNWNVFAPRPRREGLRLDAVVTWSDGRRTTWRPPEDGALAGAYRDYRWRKWMEHAASQQEGPWLWPQAIRYVARRLSARGSAVPVEIRLVRYTRPLAPPGASAARGWTGAEVYRARLEVRRR